MNNLIVLKCGGSMINEMTDEFFQSIKELRESGAKLVIVHGGGPAINDLLGKLSIESEFINGLRKTCAETIDVAEMVLSGGMANKLVRSLQKQGVRALAMTGFDGGCIQAKAKDFATLGFVGDIVHVDGEFLGDILNMGFVPVISPIALGIDEGERYNVNADTAAAAIASALSADRLLFITDVPGILSGGELVREANKSEIEKMIAGSIITGGMIPKVEACLAGLAQGVEETMIVSGRASLMQNGTLAGTVIKKELEAIN